MRSLQVRNVRTRVPTSQRTAGWDVATGKSAPHNKLATTMYYLVNVRARGEGGRGARRAAGARDGGVGQESGSEPATLQWGQARSRWCPLPQ